MGDIDKRELDAYITREPDWLPSGCKYEIPKGDCDYPWIPPDDIDVCGPECHHFEKLATDDPDEGLELRPEIIERLEKSKALPKEELLSADEMKRKLAKERDG